VHFFHQACNTASSRSSRNAVRKALADLKTLEMNGLPAARCASAVEPPWRDGTYALANRPPGDDLEAVDPRAAAAAPAGEPLVGAYRLADPPTVADAPAVDRRSATDSPAEEPPGITVALADEPPVAIGRG